MENTVISSDNSLIIPNNYLLRIPNYKTEDVAMFMEKVFPAMVGLFREKDINYGGSWAHRGIMSAQLNFERKFDRVNTQFYNGTILKQSNENIGDTFVDCSVYSVMYLYYLYINTPAIKMQVDKFIADYSK